MKFTISFLGVLAVLAFTGCNTAPVDTTEYLATCNGRIYLMKPSGEITWEKTGCGNAHRAFLRDGVIYWSNSGLWKTDRATGVTTRIYTPAKAGDAIYGFDLCPNGDLIVAENSTDDICRITPDGRDVWRFKGDPLGADKKPLDPHQHYRMVRITPQGTVLVCCSGAGLVREYTPRGKLVWETKAPHGFAFDALRRENGNTLVTDLQTVSEITPKHAVVWSFDCAQAKDLKVANLCGIQEFADGSLLLGTYGNGKADGSQACAIEITRGGQVLWSYAPKADRNIMSIFKYR